MSVAFCLQSVELICFSAYKQSRQYIRRVRHTHRPNMQTYIHDTTRRRIHAKHTCDCLLSDNCRPTRSSRRGAAPPSVLAHRLAWQYIRPSSDFLCCTSRSSLFCQSRNSAQKMNLANDKGKMPVFINNGSRLPWHGAGTHAVSGNRLH